MTFSERVRLITSMIFFVAFVYMAISSEEIGTRIFASVGMVWFGNAVVSMIPKGIKKQ